MVQKALVFLVLFFLIQKDIFGINYNLSGYNSRSSLFEIVVNKNDAKNFYILTSPLGTPFSVSNKSNQKVYIFQNNVFFGQLIGTHKLETNKNTILYSDKKFPSSILNIALINNAISSKNFLSNQTNISFQSKISKSQLNFKNRYLIGILFFLVILIILRNVNPIFFKNLFQYKLNSNILLERSSAKINYYQGENIFFIVLASILFALLSSIYSESLVKYLNKIFYNQFNFVPEYLFLVVFIFFIVIFMLRWIHNYIVSLLFGLTNLSKILSNEFSRSVLQVTFLFFPIILMLNNPYKNPDYLNVNFVLFFWFLIICIFAIKELYYFYKLFNFKKIYIIAYICICDLFPTSVLLKFLTKIEFL